MPPIDPCWMQHLWLPQGPLWLLLDLVVWWQIQRKTCAGPQNDSGVLDEGQGMACDL